MPDKEIMDLQILEMICINNTMQNQRIALFKIYRAGIPPASLETSLIKKER